MTETGMTAFRESDEIAGRWAIACAVRSVDGGVVTTKCRRQFAPIWEPGEMSLSLVSCPDCAAGRTFDWRAGRVHIDKGPDVQALFEKWEAGEGPILATGEELERYRQWFRYNDMDEAEVDHYSKTFEGREVRT